MPIIKQLLPSGGSKAVVLPKPFLEQLGLTETENAVALLLDGQQIVITKHCPATDDHIHTSATRTTQTIEGADRMTTDLYPDTVITGELAEHLRDLPDRWELVKGHLHALSPKERRRAGMVAHLANLLQVRLNTLKDIAALAESPELAPNIAILADHPGLYTTRRPDTVRAPDLILESYARMANTAENLAHLPVPPELVIEIISPSNTEAEIAVKTKEYLAAGVDVVWILDLDARRLTKHYLRALDDDEQIDRVWGVALTEYEMFGPPREE